MNGSVPICGLDVLFISVISHGTMLTSMTVPKSSVLFLVVVTMVAAAAASAGLAGNLLPPTAASPSHSIASSSVSSPHLDGSLVAVVSVGPTAPVCTPNSGNESAPSYFQSVLVVVTDSEGRNTNLPTTWASNGCEATGSASAALPYGDYTLALSSCPWMGCHSSLPKALTIETGRTTAVQLDIDTGIR